MPTREIISRTMQNMYFLYQDVGETISLVEDKMKHNSFTPLGDAACTWEVATAYNKPKQWLYTWFARVYYKDTLFRRTIGFCLHLGAYSEELEAKLAGLGVCLPAINVSLIEFPKDVNGPSRPGVLDSFWSAGWTSIKSPVVEGNVVRSEITEHALGKAVTFFVDFLTLNGKEPVEQLIATPRVKMFAGEETWVNKEKLPVVSLPASG